MKKLILLSILCALFYSVPGYAEKETALTGEQRLILRLREVAAEEGREKEEAQAAQQQDDDADDDDADSDDDDVDSDDDDVDSDDDDVDSDDDDVDSDDDDVDSDDDDVDSDEEDAERLLGQEVQAAQETALAEREAAVEAPEAAAPGVSSVPEVVKEKLVEALAETLAETKRIVARKRQAERASLKETQEETEETEETEEIVARLQATLASVAASLKETPAERVAATEEEAAAPPAKQMDAAVRGFQEQITTSCGRLVTALQARGDELHEQSQKRRVGNTALWRTYYTLRDLKFLGPVNQEYDESLAKLNSTIKLSDTRFFVRDGEENRKRDLTDSKLRTTELRKIMQQASDLQPAAAKKAPAWAKRVAEERAAEEAAVPTSALSAAERADARQLKELGGLRGEMVECQRHGRPPVTEPQAIADAFIRSTSRMRDLADEQALEPLEDLQRATDYTNKMIALSIIGWNEVEEAHKTASVCYEALLEQAAKDDSYTSESTGASFDDAKAVPLCCGLSTTGRKQFIKGIQKMLLASKSYGMFWGRDLTA